MRYRDSCTRSSPPSMPRRLSHRRLVHRSPPGAPTDPHPQSGAGQSTRRAPPDAIASGYRAHRRPYAGSDALPRESRGADDGSRSKHSQPCTHSGSPVTRRAATYRRASQGYTSPPTRSLARSAAEESTARRAQPVELRSSHRERRRTQQRNYGKRRSAANTGDSSRTITSDLAAEDQRRATERDAGRDAAQAAACAQ